jgi:hypothetical protein
MGCCASCNEGRSCEAGGDCRSTIEYGENPSYSVCADRLSLDARVGIVTALEPRPLVRANAVRVGVYVFAGSGLLNATVSVQGSNDLSNYQTLTGAIINGLGFYALQATGIAYAWLRVHVSVAASGTSSYAMGVDMSCALL